MLLRFISLIVSLVFILSACTTGMVMKSNKFSKFLDQFPPDGKLSPYAGELNDDLKMHAHPLLVEFWREVGFGSFGDGFISFFHPDEYNEILNRWLMNTSPDPTRIPFARTAFGDLIYFRDLSEKAGQMNLAEALDDASDVSFVSIHYRRSDVISYSMQGFFERDLLEFLNADDTAMYHLYQKVKSIKRTENDCLFFKPALALGGLPQEKFVDSGDCKIHNQILYDFAIQQ